MLLDESGFVEIERNGRGTEVLEVLEIYILKGKV